MRTITIYADGTFATSGNLTEHGSIRDADGVFGDEDATEAVYEAIELAADAGEDSVEIGGVRYTWKIEGGQTWADFAAQVRDWEREIAPGSESAHLGDILEDARKRTGWTTLQQWEEGGESVVVPQEFVDYWTATYQKEAE